MYLIKSLRRTVKCILEHKILFVALFFLQLVLLVGIFSVSLFYQLKIYQEAQVIFGSFQNANFNADEIKAGANFLPEINSLVNAYQALIGYVIALVLWLSGLYLIVNGVLWVGTNYLVVPTGLKSLAKQWLKFVLTSAILILPFFVLGYYLLKMFLMLEGDTNLFGIMLQIISYVLLVVYYFLLVALASMREDYWKLFFKRIYTLSLKKIFKTLSVLIINALLIATAGFGVYYFSSEDTFGLMVLASAVLVIILVLARLFWVATLEEIANEAHHH